MKQITTPAGKLGPFDSVVTTDTGYTVTVGGATAELPFTVVGKGTVANWAGPMPAEPGPPPGTPQQCHDWLYELFDEAAQRAGWDNRNTLYARLAYPEGAWYPVAVSFAAWMDQCERAALLAQADNSTPLPHSKEQLAAMLPTWEAPKP